MHQSTESYANGTEKYISLLFLFLNCFFFCNCDNANMLYCVRKRSPGVRSAPPAVGRPCSLRSAPPPKIIPYNMYRRGGGEIIK